jgi:hypothetical protein
MSLADLQTRVASHQKEFIRVGQHVMADGKVDCDEARRWLDWYAPRAEELRLLRQELTLEMRLIREGFNLRHAAANVRGQKAKIRAEQTLTLAPYQAALVTVQRMRLEGEKLSRILKKLLVKDCAENA